MALVNHLKVCQKQKDHTEQENASLKKRLVSMLSSQVRRVEGFGQSSRGYTGQPWDLFIKQDLPFVSTGGADKDVFTTSKVFKEVFCIAFMPFYKHTPVLDVWLHSHYTQFS